MTHGEMEMKDEAEDYLTPIVQKKRVDLKIYLCYCIQFLWTTYRQGVVNDEVGR